MRILISGRRAAEAVGEARGLAALAALAAALEDESKGVRDAAARSLCTIGGINVARAIVEYIGHENIITRNLAAELLMKLGVTPSPPWCRISSMRIRIPGNLPWISSG